MGIFYKEREIDYIKTMGSLEVGGQVVIPTSENDIGNIRAQVHKIAKVLPEGMAFSVHKTINGACIHRTQ
jgi:hypothetical protein